MTPFVLFLARRLLFAVFLVLVVSTGSLWLAHLAPGDYATQLRRPGVSADTVARERERLGLDRPLSGQYRDWLVWRGSTSARHTDMRARSRSWSENVRPTPRCWRVSRC